VSLSVSFCSAAIGSSRSEPRCNTMPCSQCVFIGKKKTSLAIAVPLPGRARLAPARAEIKELVEYPQQCFVHVLQHYPVDMTFALLVVVNISALHCRPSANCEPSALFNASLPPRVSTVIRRLHVSYDCMNASCAFV